jgi:hypothetical protein
MKTRLILAIIGIAALASTGMAQDTEPSTADAPPPPAQSSPPTAATEAATESTLRKVKDDDRIRKSMILTARRSERSKRS